MATKTLFPLSGDLFVTFKTKETDAVSFSVKTKSLVKVLSLVLFVFFLFGIGTLLFLRELEQSRKLEDRLLQMEIRSLIASEVPAAVALPQPKVEVAEKPVVKPVETETVPSPETFVTARVQEFSPDCIDGTCTVQLSLTPSQTGVAQGEILIVLEAEVPRIGTAGTNTAVRKRFFFYPTAEPKDEFTDAQVNTQKRKAFRFGRALQTSTDFSIGEVLRPIAANLYLYDAKGEMIHHERKVIQTGEGDVE